MLLQVRVAPPPAKSTTPPFALNAPPLTVNVLLIMVVPDEAMKVEPALRVNVLFVTKVYEPYNVAPELRVRVPPDINVEYRLASQIPATTVAPVIVTFTTVPKLPPFTVSALGFTVVNPERDEPVLRVKVPVVKVTAPVPLSVPLRVMELGIVGLLPRGSEQLAPMVLLPV